MAVRQEEGAVAMSKQPEALRLAEENGIEYAILKARSPSCGNKVIYDGSFSGRIIEGQGVTAALLEQSGIQVLNEDDIEEFGSVFEG